MATINSLALAGYIILIIIILGLLAGGGSLTGFILLLILTPLLLVLSFLASYILATSYSKYFACRIGFFQALKIAFELTLQIMLFGILALILGTILFFVDFFLGILFFVITYFIFPLTAFFYVQEWIMENKDNQYLSRNPNRNYFGNLSRASGAAVPPGIYQQNFQQSQPYYHQQSGGQPPQNLQQPSGQAPQPDVKTRTFCQHCGKLVENPNTLFCQNCGSKLDK